MPTPKISVIVPVYKAEKYLNKCVDSLLAQTFTDFEVLLIDDGSPDCSGKICDEYARKDNRVKVFHKENGGVSSARQFGIDHAQGEYTIHADPDDWVESDMLEELYKKAKMDDADMVICDYYEEYIDKRVYMKQQPTAMTSIAIINDLLFQRLHGSLWNKLVKRVCYKQYDIHFEEGLNFCEDLILNIRLLKNPLHVSYLPKSFYHYDQWNNDASITRQHNSDFYIQRKFLVSLLKSELENPLLLQGYENIFTKTAIEIFFSDFCTQKEFKQEYFNEKMILLRNAPWRLKVFLYLSAIGLRDTMRKVYKRIKITLFPLINQK